MIKSLTFATLLTFAASVPAAACLAILDVTAPTVVFAGPNADLPLETLRPPDRVCLVAVQPGAHPALIAFTRLGQRFAGNVTWASEAEMSAAPTSE